VTFQFGVLHRDAVFVSLFVAGLAKNFFPPRQGSEYFSLLMPFPLDATLYGKKCEKI
jgi:hypothetical protein